MQTIVLLEANGFVRELILGLLDASGYVVFATDQLQEGVELVSQCQANLLILSPAADPSPEGEGLASLLEASLSKAPVLLIPDETDLATERGEPLHDLARRLGGELIDRAGFTSAGFLARCQALAPIEPKQESTGPAPDAANAGTSRPGLASVPESAKRTDAPSHSAPAKGNPTSANPKPNPQPRKPIAQPTAQIDELGLLKTLKPLVSRSEVDEVVDRAFQMPIHPGLAERVLATLDAEGASPTDWCRAVSRDPALVLRTLAAAAEATQSRQEPVASLLVAIDRIGTDGLRKLIQEAGDPAEQAEAYGHHRAAMEACGIDLARSWRHAQAVALIAGEVSRLSMGTLEHIQAARTTGWLHGVGRAVLAFALPDAYAEAIEASEALGLPLERVEQQMMLDDHHQVMEKVLRRMRVAASLATAIGCHSRPIVEARNLAGKHLQDALVLAIADRYAAAIGTGDPLADPLKGVDHYVTAMKLEPAKLASSFEACLKQLQADTAGYAKAIGQDAMAWTSLWEDSLDGEFRNQVRPLFVGSAPSIDAFAWLARSLNPQAGGGVAPNLGIVRITNVRERDALTGVLRAKEIELNVGRLPLLIVSPKGNLTLEDGAMSGREVALLAEPVAPRKLIAALPGLLSPEADLGQAA